MAKKLIKNAFTVDVEDYFQVAAFDAVISRDDWDSIAPRVVTNTEKVLDILAANNVRATFFVLGWIADRHPGLVRKIAEAGHELGCHGYSHERIYRQQKRIFKSETQRAKRSIEDASGQRLIGYRAASFSITQESLWALDTLVEEGFEYDSSIFPVRHDNYGIPGAGHEPSRLETPSGKSLIEFPLNTLSIMGMRLPIGGGGYFRLYPYSLTRSGLKRINKTGQPFVFYMHPWEVDPQQPEIKASALSRFRHYNNLHKCEARLGKLLTQFAFSTCEDVLTDRGLLSRTPGRESAGVEM